MSLWQRLLVNNRKVVFTLFVSLLISLGGFAHSVTGYTKSCITGPKYSLDAVVSNVNSSSNYAWQYKNSSGNWICIVNGNNTINGFVYSVSGATSTATTNPAPLVFNNPNSNLDNLVVRCVISDGSGVNPCNMPSGNTWNSNSSSVNHTIDVTSTPCGASVCNASLSSLVFNKLDGGTDITITNGGSYTTNQLGSLYNIEANTAGTVGSVVFTITGPSAGSSTENSTPYNYPATGNGAWTPAAGSHTINVKVYSGAGATGTLCDQETFTITVTNDCVCPGNVLTNPSFENSATGWTVSGGTLTFGTNYEMCGSYNGFLNWSSGTAKLYQDVTIPAGSTISFKGYAGTHQPGLACSPKLSLIYLNSSNGVISQSDATVTFDVGSGSTLALYTINATAPAGTVKVRVQGSITCNTLKVDGFCLTFTPPVIPPCQNTNETFPNQFNTGFATSINSTFTGSTGTWSATSNAGATTIVTTPYYSPSTTHAIKIVNWKTNGTYNGFSGTGTTTATSPTVNLSTGVCCPTSLQMVFTLWTYTCTSGDTKASVALQFYNGTSWVTVWTKTSGELFSAYGADGKTNITVAVPAAYQNSPFKYRFTGTSTNNANNFYLFIDDIKISSVVCPLGSLGDYVWDDVNANGKQDPNEIGIPNVQVTLRNSANVVVGTTTTNPSGIYSFNNLPAGTYSVTFATPAGYIPTPVANGPFTDEEDSDPVGGIVTNIVLPAGAVNKSIDAGFVKLSSLGDFVWEDRNSDGDQDPGEPGIPGVQVTLRNASNVVVGTTETNANGIYSFTNLTSGTYSVTFATPAGYAPTPIPDSETAGDALDSDPIGGVASGIEVPVGGSNLTVDAGFVKLINLSGNVWHDVNAMTDNLVNNSGAAQTPPAVPIPANLKAYLVNLTTGLVEMVTFVNPADGKFAFPNVMPNTTYYVLISVNFGVLNAPPPVSLLPSGWSHTGQRLGSPAATGHDGLNDGRLVAPVANTDVINVNFGIKISGGDVVIG